MSKLQKLLGWKWMTKESRKMMLRWEVPSFRGITRTIKRPGWKVLKAVAPSRLTRINLTLLQVKLINWRTRLMTGGKTNSQRRQLLRRLDRSWTLRSFPTKTWAWQRSTGTTRQYLMTEWSMRWTGELRQRLKTTCKVNCRLWAILHSFTRPWIFTWICV